MKTALKYICIFRKPKRKIHSAGKNSSPAASAPPAAPVPTPVVSLRRAEQAAIENALAIYGVTTEGKRQAAKALGIGLATLYRKLEQFQ